MSDFKIITDDAEKEFGDRSEFEDMKQLLDEQGVDYETEETDTPEPEPELEPEPVPTAADGNGDIPEPSQLTSDPLDVISQNAEQFTDTIKGTVTINRQGYAVLAERFNISVQAEPVTLASETEFEFAEFRAVATTEDGAEYTGFGSAHVDRDTDDDPHLLNELAETRAMKRATAWATGVGMTAMAELSGELRE